MDSVQVVWCSIKHWVSWTALRLKDGKVLSSRDEQGIRCLNLPLKLVQQ